MDAKELVRKYNVPGPRYTSYPTVPHWDAARFSIAGWKASLQAISLADGLSLYIHLPYCETLCTYCGCTTHITKNHHKEMPYIEAVLKEWALYKEIIGTEPAIKELHLGGGTPTFFAPEHLNFLLNGLLGNTTTDLSVEAHPFSTTPEHLEVFRQYGARRISFGIQDFNPTVQTIINRIQPRERVEQATKMAREMGFTSINYDLIYGLPGQTLDTLERTIAETLELNPDRIAFYSYAHVPTIKPAQRSFEHLLPTMDEKLQFYETGKALLREGGYLEIGMDHFALPGNELTEAFESGTLHRNFMGYTVQKTNCVIGLGMSSISDSWSAFAQNVKTEKEYLRRIESGGLPLLRGHLLSADDLKIRQQILNLMCTFTTEVEEEELEPLKARLNEMEADELITWQGKRLTVTDAGKPFIRNVCMAFDAYLPQAAASTFSRTI